MWLTISGFLGMLSFADLGLGNGIMSSVARSNGLDDDNGVKTAAICGLFSMGAIAAAITAIFFCVTSSVNWAVLFNVHTRQAVQDAPRCMAVFAICFAIGLPSSVVQKVQAGLQRSYLASAWQCIASLTSLLLLVLVVKLRLATPYLVGALMGGSILASALNNITFFALFKVFRPAFYLLDIKYALGLFRSGGLFFVLQFVCAITYGSDAFIISRVLGATFVPQYAIPERLFGFGTMLISIALAPLWPAYREAYMRSDHRWIRNTLRRSFQIALTISLASSLFFIVFSPWIISAWIGPKMNVSIPLIIGLALWKILDSLGGCVAVLLNALHVVKFQVVFSLLTGVTSLGFEVYLVAHFGVSGAVWATVFAYTILTLIPYFIFVPRIIARMVPINLAVISETGT